MESTMHATSVTPHRERRRKIPSGVHDPCEFSRRCYPECPRQISGGVHFPREFKNGWRMSRAKRY
eukprot:3731102-Pyramimonas_sp.AAC.1